MSKNFLDDVEKKMTRLWWEEMQSVSDVFYLTVYGKDYNVIAGEGKRTKIELALTDGRITNTEAVELTAMHDGVIEVMAIKSVVKTGILSGEITTFLALIEPTNICGETVTNKSEVEAGDTLIFREGSLRIYTELRK